MSAVHAPLPPITPAFVNPAHMNATAGPSSTVTKKKPTPCPKRKRTDTPESGTESTAPARKVRDGPKKKKANRACFHCQKAHLTCDDSRPCQRCTKRGIASSCTEGHRKKAKYLLDDDELEQLKRSKSSAPESSQEPATTEITPPEPFTQNEVLLTTSFDPGFTFGSEAANLEYSILSAILGNPSPESVTSPPSPDPTQNPYSTWPSETIDYTTSTSLGTIPPTYNPPYSDSQLPVQSSESTLAASPSTPAHYLTYPYTTQQPQPPSEEIGNPADLSQFQESRPSQPLHPLQPRFPLDSRPRSPPTSVFLHNPDISSDRLGNDAAATPATEGTSGSQLQSIHDRVTKPYDYTEGYHFLMKHLPTRFEKNDILRIVRALAIFRPSLIALQMPLSLEDEIFVEKCFQRSLLELEKLMSFSGTPTVVWRRTGEICLVAPEFCMLTEWPMEELLGGKKYIYELFENQSVVEYWENFAAHAFENTTQSVYSHCVLLKPSGAPVPATFCFSIRRDLFDLPSIVIGQWLPLL
ncbi:putative transcription factor which regulates nonfermentable carbon utilization [Lyophyllum shimeji]|uniref:Transcription activator of gluconeogenesis ERT1 n=1 Tax=Lyophyllum shimeji TaxID=47721 RepID=A0A9P3PLF3_LYOSH|nr:putative transcription factor which regulates nonfermentable carbon utilization [Lyophyllum shimeji]